MRIKGKETKKGIIKQNKTWVVRDAQLILEPEIVTAVCDISGQHVVLGPSTSVPPKSLWKDRLSSLTPELLNQDLYLNKVPRWFVCTLKIMKWQLYQRKKKIDGNVNATYFDFRANVVFNISTWKDGVLTCFQILWHKVNPGKEVVLQKFIFPPHLMLWLRECEHLDRTSIWL